MILNQYGEPVNPTARELQPKEFFSKSNIETVRAEDERKRGQWFSNYGPTVSNLASLSGTLRKPLDTPPFGMLRQVAKESLIDRAVISRRVEDIKGLARRIIVPGKQRGWRVVHRRFDDPNFDTHDEQIQRRCREVEGVIERPMRVYHKTFRDFLAVAVQEELILDRRAMVISRDRKGRPVDYYLLPGDTILPVLYVLMPWMARKGISNERVARMILSEQFSSKAGTTIDISDAAYVQEVDGQVVAAWKEDEIDVEWSNPSGEINRWGFGVSLLEQSLQATSLLLNMFNFNKDMFRPGFPARMLVLSGDYSAEGLSAFERQILGQGGSQSQKSKMPVLPGPADMKAQVLDLSNTPSDMQFEQFFRLMTSIKCSFFGMHPSRLNLSDRGPEGIILGSGSATGEISQTMNEEGLYSLLESNADWLTRTLVQPYYDDLVLIFDGLHEQNEQIVLQNLQVEATWNTKNEIRARRNLPQLTKEQGGDVIGDGLWLQWVQLMKQEQAEKEATEKYERGDFGQMGMAGAPGAPGAMPPGAPGAPGAMPPGAPGEVPPQGAAAPEAAPQPGAAPGAAPQEAAPPAEAPPQEAPQQAPQSPEDLSPTDQQALQAEVEQALKESNRRK